MTGHEQANHSRDLRTEAVEQASMLLRSGVAPAEVLGELIDNRIPEDLAAATVAHLVETRASNWRSLAQGLIWVGGALLAGGLGFTALTYAAANGESYWLATGALAGGVSALAVGIGMLAKPRS